MNPTVIGNYRIIGELGSGAMGAVYEAVDQMLERTVAIKMLRPEIAAQPELIERFRAEAVMLARLNHPSIATLYNFFRENDSYYMVMEYVRGRTLESIIGESGRLRPEVALPILRQVLEAMAHAHSMGVLHRDIKPANIMVGGDGTVKVTDFGIARILGSSRMTREGRIIGTLEYIAPERIRGEEADIRSDLYSAGVVLYEMLAGRLPFVSDTDYTLIQAHLNQAPPDFQALGVSCSQELQAVVSRALAKGPEGRFSSAEAFRDALADVPVEAEAMKPTRLAGTDPVAMPETRWASAPAVPAAPAAAATRSKLPPWWMMAAALAVVVALGGGAAWVKYRNKAPVPAAITVATPAPAAQDSAPAPPVQTQGTLPPAVQQALAPTAAPNLAAPPPNLAAALSAPANPEPPKRTGPRSLRGVKRLYIAPMQGQLDRYLFEEIRAELWDRITLVSSADEADAVMKGSAVQRRGSKDFTAQATITDREGDKVFWVGEADDKTAILGVGKHGGVKKAAGRLVSALKKAITKK